MTDRKKRLIFFILLAVALIGAVAWIYSYYSAPQRKIEKLVWELRGCPDGRLSVILGKIGIKPNKPEPRYEQLVFTELAGYGKLATPYLVELVKDKNFKDTHTAAELLAGIDDPAVIDFFKQYLKDKNREMGDLAAWFLWDTSGSQSLLDFTYLLDDKNNLNAAGLVARALGESGKKDAAGLLTAVLLRSYGNGNEPYYRDVVPFVKNECVKSLVRIGDKSVMEKLSAELYARLAQIKTVEMLANFYEPGDALAVVRSFVDMVSLIFNRTQTGSYRESYGGNWIVDEVYWTCDPFATAAIGKLGGLREAELLMELLRYEGHKPEVLTDVVPALADIGDRRAGKILVRLLKSPTVLDDEKKKKSSVGLFSDSSLRLADAIWDALVRLDARDELLDMMKSDDFKIFSRAALALVKMKDARVLARLLKMFRENVSAEGEIGRGKCIFAINCLGMLGDSKVIEPLFRETAGKDTGIRQTAFMSMIRLDNRKSLEYLMPLFNRQPATGPGDEMNKNYEHEEFAGIADAIIYYGRPEDVKTVFGRIAKRPDAESFLAHPADIFSTDYLPTVDFAHNYISLDADEVIQYLNSRNPEVREWAAETLGNLGDARAIWPLIEALKDENYKVKAASVVALSKLGDKRAVEPIIAVFDSLSHDNECIKAAGNFGDPRFAPVLMALLDDLTTKKVTTRKADEEEDSRSDYDNNQKCEFVLEALGKTKNPVAAGAIIKAIEKKGRYSGNDYQYIYGAFVALGNVGGSEAYEYLSKLPQINEKWGSNIYCGAIAALGLLQDQRAIDLLIEAIKDTSPDITSGVYESANGLSIRMTAIESIGQIGGPKAVETLVKFLDHGFLDVRVGAARALLKINDPSARPALRKAAAELHWQVRAYASAALYRIGDKSAIQSVLALIKSDDSKKCSAVFDILCILKDRDFLKYLAEELLNNPDGPYEALFMYWPIEIQIADAIVDIGGQEAMEALIKARNRFADLAEYESVLHHGEEIMDPWDKYLHYQQKIQDTIIKLQRKRAASATELPATQ